jgi:Flp pilus assembly protein TadG
MGGRDRQVGREHGAVAVEFALVVPLLLVLVFGIIEFGVVFANQISTRQGTREAARQGAVRNWGTPCPAGQPLAATGTASADVDRLICQAKNRIGTDPKNLYIKVHFVDQATGNEVTSGTLTANATNLVVCAYLPIAQITGYFPFLNGKAITSSIAINMEQSATGEYPRAETLPAGGSWSWC